MLKTLARLILGLVLLLVVAGVILLVSVNTDQNKAAIQAAVLSATGYELTIAGDMDITLFPSIGLTLNDVRLKNPASPQELASTTAALLSVDLRALLDRQILVRELSTDDLHINYYIDAEGSSNWDTEGLGSNDSAAQSQAEPPAPASDGTISVSFDQLRIANASIDIQDLSQSQRYSINSLNLVSNDTNLEGRPFDVDVDFNFLNNGMTKPMTMGFRSNVTADIDAGIINLERMAFSLTPMMLNGQLSIRDLQDSMTFEGSLASNEFDLIGLLQTMGIQQEDLDAESALLANNQRPPASFGITFSGDRSGLQLPNVSARLADTQINAEASIGFATAISPTNISYEIVSDRLDLSPFLGADTQDETVAGDNDDSEAVAASAPTPATESAAIPSALLNSFSVIGSMSIESIVVDDFQFDGITVFTNVEDGVLDIEIQPVSAFEGSIAGNIRLDGRSDDAVLATQFSLSQLDLVALAPSISRLNSATGKLDVEIDLTAEGQTYAAMADSLNGSTVFGVTESSVDIGVIKQVFTAISALSPTGGTIDQWPDVIRFAELGGFILINDGIEGNQQINLRMDNFDVSGSGGLNLAQQSFDYDLLFTILGAPYLQTIQVDEIYHDVSWPVDCASDFADDVNQYCRPDFTLVREIFTQLGTNAVRNRLDEVITDQLPPEVRDGARGLLRNLLN